ncbi:hypothetical protein RchiOBHm_Chr3g0461541 [Rosa chinensis]|uniref:Uncharacterized protein n=1 Tax=Rosa chinensis TaxID=74649 RepID=A0A2P6R8N5_ROSCH|nr:hypothetical protein RchiOBHm_Chr3g0461541 [Rosa chinensis]
MGEVEKLNERYTAKVAFSNKEKLEVWKAAATCLVCNKGSVQMELTTALSAAFLWSRRAVGTLRLLL